jgi:hypothetical protein
MKPPGEQWPRAATYYGYNALGNLETTTKTMWDAVLHMIADELSPWLQCYHDQHSSTTANPAMTWPQDHDDSHAWTNTRRWRSLQAKLVRTSLRLMTLWSSEPPLCIKPWPKTLYKDGQGTHLGIISHSSSSTITSIHHSSRAPRASLWATPHLA